MRTSSAITLLQIVTIVLGYMAVGMVLKASGWPLYDSLVRWNPLAVFLHLHGLAFLLIPCLWTICAVRAQQLDRGIFSSRAVNLAGFGLIVVFLVLFLSAAFQPYAVRHIY